MAEDFGFNPCSEPGYYFISYNSEDAERVGAIARKLHSNNVPLWYDYGIPYGEKWEAIIAEKIKKSQAVILFFTKGILFKEDSYVKKEYRIATKNFKKKVYVVMLDYIDVESVPLDKVFWFNDIRDNHNIDIVDINDPDIISNEIMSAIDIKTGEKKQNQAIENKEEGKNPFLAPVRESANNPMNNGDIFGGEPISIGSFLGNSSDNISYEKIVDSKKEEQKYTKTNKPDFPPIVPPASPSAPAVVGKLEQKNDTNNMSSKNKSDDFKDDQFYIMINDLIKGKDKESDNKNKVADVSSKSNSDVFEEDQFYIMIDDIIKGKAETEVEYKKSMSEIQTKKEEFDDMFSGVTSYEEELRAERELKAMREDIKKRAEIEINNMLNRRDSEEYVGKGTEKNCASSEDEGFDELYKLLYDDFKTKRLKANVCALTHTGASCKTSTNNYSLSGRTSMSENSPFIRTVTTAPFHLLVTNSLGRDGEKISRELINKLNYSSERVYELAKKQQDMESVIVNCIDVAKKSIISNTIFKKQTSETSLAALYFIGEIAYCINIGNTRIYHYSEGKIKRIIRGRVDPKDFTNCLEKGIYSSVEQIRDVKENDVFLLCSNGITDVIDIDTILSILSTSENSMDATTRLVQTSLDRGGKDNITAITAFMETESVIERK